MEPHETLSFVAALKVYEKHCLADGLSMSTVLNKRCNLELFFQMGTSERRGHAI
jgi:hypothetical protein